MALLVPALAQSSHRRALLAAIPTAGAPPIQPSEADAATVLHFVWVLRDAFSWERTQATNTQHLIDRWVDILDLPSWARSPVWWHHPTDPGRIVHPCQPKLGWTKPSIAHRHSSAPGAPNLSTTTAVLHQGRQTMNTECDALIQTPERLIIVECKDHTSFKREQRARQQRLGAALARLLPRPHPVVYLDVAPRGTPWTWATLANPQDT